MFITEIVKERLDGNLIYVDLFGRMIEVDSILPKSSDSDDCVVIEIKKDQLDEAQENLAGFYVVHISRLIVRIK